MTRRARPGDPRVAVAYIRVSTDAQSNGLDAQRAAIAALPGLTIASWHVDHGVSGKTPAHERPGLREALAALRPQGGGLLVVAKRCRLARDMEIAFAIEAEVKRSGAVIFAAEGGGNGEAPSDRLMRVILDGFAEHERAMIAARTKAALKAKRARGEAIGTTRFGFRREGPLEVPCPREQATLERARALRASGESFRRIARALGPVSRAGTLLTPQAVFRILAPTP